MIVPALIAKFLSAGAVAQAATGATVVVVAFTGAGAVGVLPGPVQDTFTSIVSDESEELPVEEAPVEEAPVEEVPVGEAPVAEVPVVPQPVVDEAAALVDAWMAAPIEGSFGAWVSGARHDADLMAAIRESGHNFGYYVSRRAHDKGMTEQDLAEEGVDLGELTQDGTEVGETPHAGATGDEVTPQQTADDSDRRGNGNGRGNGGNGRGNGRN